MPTSYTRACLAAELLEEALDHLGRFGNALAAVRDARLADPLLQVLDVIVDVLVDVAVDLLQLVGRNLRHVGLDLGVARGTDAEFGFRLRLRRGGVLRLRRRRRAAGSRTERGGEEDEQGGFDHRHEGRFCHFSIVFYQSSLGAAAGLPLSDRMRVMHRRLAIGVLTCLLIVSVVGAGLHGQTAARKRLLFLTHAALYKHPSLAPAEAAVTEIRQDRRVRRDDAEGLQGGVCEARPVVPHAGLSRAVRRPDADDQRQSAADRPCRSARLSTTYATARR